jgi:hypothetical protein
VLVGLAHPQHHRQQHPLAGVGEPPRDQDALLGTVRADAEKDGVDEQRREVNLIEVAAMRRREALASSAQREATNGR